MLSSDSVTFPSTSTSHILPVLFLTATVLDSTPTQPGKLRPYDLHREFRLQCTATFFDMSPHACCYLSGCVARMTGSLSFCGCPCFTPHDTYRLHVQREPLHLNMKLPVTLQPKRSPARLCARGRSCMKLRITTGSFNSTACAAPPIVWLRRRPPQLPACMRFRCRRRGWFPPTAPVCHSWPSRRRGGCASCYVTGERLLPPESSQFNELSNVPCMRHPGAGASADAKAGDKCLTLTWF